TAFHLTKPGESWATIQQAVGPAVTSECNIFALSVKDPDELPADIRDDLMAFKDAYRTPEASIETQHLDLYSGYVREFKPEHAPLVTERIVKETTLTGTPEEIRARIRKMMALGVKQVAVAGDQSVLAEFATHVIQEMK
ncbi:MAG: hypothetical protein ACRERD_18475, partial [Candidatus Binatia bacterium]